MKTIDLFLKVSINILLFILVSTTEFRTEHLHFFLLGAAINALPVLLGKMARDRTTAESLFIAATYGGGNRGVLLVSLFFPHKLLEFIMIDLGNFFSLLLVYPLASRKRYFDAQNLFMLVLATLAVSGGIYMRRTSIACNYCGQIKSTILYAIIVYSVFQIIQWLRRNRGLQISYVDFVVFLRARVCVILPLFLLYYLLGGEWMTMLLVFIFLPVSSLLFAIYRPEDKIYQRVIRDTVASTLLYLFALVSLLLLRLIPFFD